MVYDLHSQESPRTSDDAASMAQVVQLVTDTATKWAIITSLHSHCTVFLAQEQQGTTAEDKVIVLRIIPLRFNTKVLNREQTSSAALVVSCYCSGERLQACLCASLETVCSTIQWLYACLSKGCHSRHQNHVDVAMNIAYQWCAAFQYKNYQISPMYVTWRGLDYMKSGIYLQQAMETVCEEPSIVLHYKNQLTVQHCGPFTHSRTTVSMDSCKHIRNNKFFTVWNFFNLKIHPSTTILQSIWFQSLC